MKDLNEIQSRLEDFHKDKVDFFLKDFSELAGNQFQGEFNVSGFHNQILELPNKAQSLWGIDRCLRIQEIPDGTHSYLFHMGIFAKSIDLNNNFIDPFKDARFHQLQEEVITQFLEVLDLFNVDLNELEATYLDGITIGNNAEGRDRLLKRKYEFPTDAISKKLLNEKIKLFPVKSLANVDINPVEGALVGPRLEIAYRGIEIGTLVFNCFKIEQGNLVPINYVTGYAIGIERLAISLQDRTLIGSISRYQEAYKTLVSAYNTASSSLFEKESISLIYGAEVLAHIPNELSEHQKEKIRLLNKKMQFDLKNLGAFEDVLTKLSNHFKQWKYL